MQDSKESDIAIIYQSQNRDKCISLITLNCCLLPKHIIQNHYNETESAKLKRIQNIINLISLYDVVCLQEVWELSYKQMIESSTKHCWKYDKVDSKLNSGLMIGIKGDIKQYKHVKFNDNTFIHSFINRGIQKVICEIKNTIITVLNIQTVANIREDINEASLKRKSQIDQLHSLIANAKTYFILGDMNERDYVLQRFKGCHISFEDASNNTYHELHPLGKITDEFNCVDYIISNIRHISKICNIILSDHYPVTSYAQIN